MYIAIYKIDQGDALQGDIHSKNVWEYCPMLPYLDKVLVPSELEGKEIQVSKVVDISERWQLEADVVLEQPTLNTHWHLNGSILYDEPIVFAWVTDNTTGYVEPLVDAWVSGSVTGYSLPTVTRWVHDGDIQNEPVYISDGEGGTVLDERYIETEIEDTSYSQIIVMSPDYTQVITTDPDATYYEDAVNDYRYNYLPEEYHWELSEDIVAQEIADGEAFVVKFKSVFKLCREKWQEMADNFAYENSALGITAEGKTKEVADAFRDVDFYLRLNSPHEALKAIDEIVRGDKYLTEERLTALRDEFSQYLIEITS